MAKKETIHRVIHNAENPYFMMNRASCNDRGLSYKALGLHCYLLSKPDQWTVRETELARAHTEGTTAVRSALRELRLAGYTEAVITRSEDGRINGSEIHIYEIPPPHLLAKLAEAAQAADLRENGADVQTEPETPADAAQASPAGQDGAEDTQDAEDGSQDGQNAEVSPQCGKTTLRENRTTGKPHYGKTALREIACIVSNDVLINNDQLEISVCDSTDRNAGSSTHTPPPSSSQPTSQTTPTTPQPTLFDGNFDGDCGPPVYASTGTEDPGKISPRPKSQPLIDPRILDRNGYVAEGAGTDPYSVYRECSNLSLRKPTVRKLNATITDLDKWRAVVNEYSLAGYKMTNISNMIRIYREGWQTNGNSIRTHGQDSSQNSRAQADQFTKLNRPDLTAGREAIASGAPITF